MNIHSHLVLKAFHLSILKPFTSPKHSTLPAGWSRISFLSKTNGSCTIDLLLIWSYVTYIVANKEDEEDEEEDRNVREPPRKKPRTMENRGRFERELFKLWRRACQKQNQKPAAKTTLKPPPEPERKSKKKKIPKPTPVAKPPPVARMPDPDPSSLEEEDEDEEEET